MQKVAQAWFSQGPGGDDQQMTGSSSSILADWNSYAASKSSDESTSLGFDLEAAVRSANDTVSGTFSVYGENVD